MVTAIIAKTNSLRTHTQMHTLQTHLLSEMMQITDFIKEISINCKPTKKHKPVSGHS